MALGADKGSVFRLFLAEQLRLVCMGVAAGIVATLVVVRMLPSVSHLLKGVAAQDPLTLIVSASVLIMVAVLASYLPARRAMNVDPMVALRHE